MTFSEPGSPMTMKSPRVPPHEPAPDNSDPLKGYSWHLFIGLMLLFLGLSLWSAITAPSPVPSVDYSEFCAWAKRGEVKSVELAGLPTTRSCLATPAKLGSTHARSAGSPSTKPVTPWLLTFRPTPNRYIESAFSPAGWRWV